MLVAPGTFYGINQILRFARCKFPCTVVSTVHRTSDVARMVQFGAVSAPTEFVILTQLSFFF